MTGTIREKIVLYRLLSKALPLAARHYPAFVDDLQKKIARLHPERHSEDFATVRWYGRSFRFNPTQAEVVRLLWQARENGTPYLRTSHLIERAGVSGNRLDHLFRKKGVYHESWGVMLHLVEGGLAVIERRKVEVAAKVKGK